MNNPLNLLTQGEFERLASITERIGVILQTISRIQKNGYEHKSNDIQINNREQLGIDFEYLFSEIASMSSKGDINFCEI